MQSGYSNFTKAACTNPKFFSARIWVCDHSDLLISWHDPVIVFTHRSHLHSSTNLHFTKFHNNLNFYQKYFCAPYSELIEKFLIIFLQYIVKLLIFLVSFFFCYLGWCFLNFLYYWVLFLSHELVIAQFKVLLLHS